MADLNEVRLIGRLTRDPEVRMIPSGQQVANFGMATNRTYRAADGSQRKETTYIEVTCWAKLAELVSRYLRKGRQVYLGGRLRYEDWVDKETGKKRNKLTVVADNVQFLDRREDGPDNNYAGGNNYQSDSQNYQSQAPASAPPAPANDLPPTWEDPDLDVPPF